MPQTLVQKLVARAAGCEQVGEGELVSCRVDLALLHDAEGPHQLAPMLAELGARIWDREKVALVLEDDPSSAVGSDATRLARLAREFAVLQGIPHVFAGQGTSHVAVPQSGLIRPGMLGVCSDSHAPSAGAFGAYMFGVGPSELLGVLVSGEIRLRVPQTMFMRWMGRLCDGVGAMDMALAMLGRFGAAGGGYQAVEFCGEAVAALSMPARMTLAAMSVEFGAQAGLVPPDDTTRNWLDAAGADVDELGLVRWYSDDAAPGTWHSFDASALAPQVALAGTDDVVRPVDGIDPTRIDVACLGACTGATIDDLRAAARVLAGYKVAAGVRLLVAPASPHDLAVAEREGLVRHLLDAGATLLPAAFGTLGGPAAAAIDGATVISSTSGAFAGPAAATAAQVYLGSPFTVAASALRGRIADARDVLQ